MLQLGLLLASTSNLREAVIAIDGASASWLEWDSTLLGDVVIPNKPPSHYVSDSNASKHSES